MLNSGVDPNELMRAKGVMGNTNIIEKIVHVEDKQKMEDFQQKLEIQKQEMRKKAQDEKEQIEKQANMKKEDKARLLDEIRKREEAEDKSKTKQ